MVAAWHSSNPVMAITTTVDVTILRNEFSPVFEQTSYEARISEHDAIGTNITRVHANDEDVEVGLIKCFG